MGKTNVRNYYVRKASGEYNFPVSPRHEPFFKAIRSEHEGCLGKVLDIGCGKGIAGEPELGCKLVKGAEEVVGVDPNIGTSQAPKYVDSFVESTLEDANLPDGYFDTAYSFMVMEHIKNPEAFFSALKDCLRIGGVYIFMTPNPQSFFGLSARCIKRLGVEEYVLSLLADDLEYHHELGYEMVDESDIQSCASGFKCDFVYSGNYNAVRSYLRGPLRPILYSIMLKRYIWRKPKSLMYMTARCVRME